MAFFYYFYLFVYLLQIYDGSNTSAPLLFRGCETKPEGFISATGNQMLLKLVTDGRNVAKGFRAHFKTGK